jgi:hypothetical protein
MLNKTEAGKKALARHLSKGRTICFGKDYQPPGGIGPLFVKQTMKIKDNKNGTCLEVDSLAEGPASLRTPIFPGTFYCKLISPARIIDYIMTDSLKKHSTCLNKD